MKLIAQAALCSVALAFSHAAPAQCPPSFAVGPMTAYAPGAIVGTDFNLDGIPDLVASSGQIVPVRGLGGGSYQVLPAVTGANSYSPVIADVDRDGRPDIVYAHNQNDVVVLHNNSNGTFTGFGQYFIVSGSGTPFYISPGDLNNDGIVDLAVSMNNNNLYTLINNGAGGFTPGPVLAGGAGWQQIADMNGDGRTDLVSGAVNSFRVFYGNGNATFGAPQSYPMVDPGRLVLADLNGDGLPDVAATNPGYDSISVCLNTGGGMFAPPTALPSGSFPEYIIASDLNGDGRPDLAASCYNSSSISVYMNNGNGTFQPQIAVYPPPYNPSGLVAQDVNNDGHPDLVTVVTFANPGGIVPLIYGGNYLVSITQNPTAGQSLYQAGQTAAMTAGASSNGTLSYQWRKNGVNLTNDARISGSSTNALSIANATSSDTGAYDVVVRSSCNGQLFDTRTSGAGVLAVTGSCTPPSLTQQPQNQSLREGQQATFTVGAAGPGLTYQWRKNGVNLVNGGNVAGATASSLVLSSLAAADNLGIIDCLVTNSCGSVRTDAAGLGVRGCGSADFNADGDVGTDADITAFFQVLAGGHC